MPDMPSWIAKGSILMALDDASQGTLRNIRDRLIAGDRVEDVAFEELNLSEPARDHLRDDWFSNNGWWGRDVSDVIRNGFTYALSELGVAGEEVQGKPKKIDCYWTCCCSGTAVELMFNVKGDQLTVIIKTPPASGPATGTTAEEFWVVNSGTGAPTHPQYLPI
jgi:hypothetical protein